MTKGVRPASRRRSRPAALTALFIILIALLSACGISGRVEGGASVEPQICITPSGDLPAATCEPTDSPGGTASPGPTGTDSPQPTSGSTTATSSPGPTDTGIPRPTGTATSEPTASGSPTSTSTSGARDCVSVKDAQYSVGATTVYAAADPTGLNQLAELRSSDATFVVYFGPYASAGDMKQWMAAAACSGLNLRIEADRVFEHSDTDAKNYFQALDANVAAINADLHNGGTVSLTYVLSQNGGSGSTEELNQRVSTIQSVSSTPVHTWLDFTHQNNNAGVAAANQFKGSHVIAYFPCCGSSKYGSPDQYGQAASLATKVQPGHPAMAVQGFSWPEVDPAFAKEMGFDSTQPSPEKVGQYTAAAADAGVKDVTVQTLGKTAENTQVMIDMINAAAKELKP